MTAQDIIKGAFIGKQVKHQLCGHHENGCLKATKEEWLEIVDVAFPIEEIIDENALDITDGTHGVIVSSVTRIKLICENGMTFTQNDIGFGDEGLFDGYEFRINPDLQRETYQLYNEYGEEEGLVSMLSSEYDDFMEEFEKYEYTNLDDFIDEYNDANATNIEREYIKE